MKIDNLVRIIDGKLLTLPSIDSFESFVFEPSKINRGDLFFDTLSSHEKIQEAIQKGAYAVLTTLPFMGEDSEIAWIKVEDKERSLIKILRYLTTQKSLKISIATSIQASFLNALQSPKKIKILKGDIFSIAKEILKAQEEELFCLTDKTTALLLSPNAIEIHAPLHVEQIVSKGLFITSFLYQEHYIQELKVPSLWVRDLVGVLIFCEQEKITFSIDSFTPIEHFYPLFVTNNIRKKEFGMSDRVLIFEENEIFLQMEMDYLMLHAPIENLCLCLPMGINPTFEFKGKIISYSTCNDLEDLALINFKYALLLGKKEDFESLLTRDLSTQLTLF